MREVKADKAFVAYCGLYCGACGAYLKEKCKGCHENAKASWCKVRACCIERGYATCAECTEFAEAGDCRKFNNVISKLFGFIFSSDRAACIRQVKEIGVEGHAKRMAEAKQHTIKRPKKERYSRGAA